MNSKKFKSVGILIITVLIAAILFHGYAFINNYREAYNQFTKEVTLSFDNALKNYLQKLSEVDVIVITDFKENTDTKFFNDSSKLAQAINKNFFQRFSESPFSEKGAEILEKKVKELDGLNITQITIEGSYDQEELFLDKENNIVMMSGRKAADSISALSSISNKLIISTSRDTIDFQLLTQFFNDELLENKISIEYGITHFRKDSLVGEFRKSLVDELPLQYTSRADLLPSKEKLILHYENASLHIFREGLINSSFSLAFFVLVTFVLFFLYKTIKNQKDLSEIKNDLINNITHEFKTPLATISMAIEGMQSFNPENDPEKNKKYLKVGQQQVNKMTAMVEKLLETATLDSEKLMIKKENIEIQAFCRELFDRYQNHGTDKTLSLDLGDENSFIVADKFHLENALSNLLDNAFKYGGNQITFSYKKKGEQHCFTVSDNGGKLSKVQSKRVFDKFYRIPQGNIHNVKGFGIGLYYSKKVIEKHNGSLELNVSKNLTQFEICLP